MSLTARPQNTTGKKEYVGAKRKQNMLIDKAEGTAIIPVDKTASKTVDNTVLQYGRNEGRDGT